MTESPKNRPADATQTVPVAPAIAGGSVCVVLACIAVWNEIQRFPGPISLADVPSIAGRQVAAMALFLVGLFLIWSAYRARRQR